MKAKLDRSFIINFSYSFLIVLMISCNNQGKSNKLKYNSQAIENKIGAIRLKYTSGVRSILEDSKGNVWFGSYSEGVCLFRNAKFHYFTTENGLSHNQVRNIYEDKNGIIWFECGKGLSTYNGKQITPYRERNYNAKNDWKLNDSDIWFKGNEIEAYLNGIGFSSVKTLKV